MSSMPDGGREDAVSGFYVRRYDPDRDAADLRGAFIELQEAERAIDPHMPPGEMVADAYLDRLFEGCAEHEGEIYLAEDETTGKIAGYVAVFGRVASEEPDDDPSPYAYLSDLVVLSEFRGRGLGPILVDAAEAHARASGVRRIRLLMLSENEGARRLYERSGFRAHVTEMEKRF